MLLSRLAKVRNSGQVARAMKMLSLRRWQKLLIVFIGALVTFILVGKLLPVATVAQTPSPHNAIIFVADGLRPSSVNATDTPALYSVGQRGVSFPNSHSLFPTFTTANGAAIATGHYLGDSGDFSNTIAAGFPVPSAGNSLTPFLENDAVLADIGRPLRRQLLE